VRFATGHALDLGHAVVRLEIWARKHSRISAAPATIHSTSSLQVGMSWTSALEHREDRVRLSDHRLQATSRRLPAASRLAL
jgi:hypothetical protein